VQHPIYPSWANGVYRAVIAVFIAIPACAVVGPMLYVRTPYNTNQFTVLEQPVEFDHRHHVRDNGIECLYCHSGAERSPHAGVPTSGQCMGCHSQVWTHSPLLERVRDSYFAGTPLNWRRVHDLPDYVYFDHSVHVTNGIGCERCHGDVSSMARVVQTQPLTMGGCIDCHRASSSASKITRLTTCSACHR
jgi:hypothetical protein